MKLYWHPFSVFPRRVQIALREKGVPYDDALVDLPGGAHRAAAFRRLNPFGQVPVLEDGDLVLSESIAILEYLDERHPTPPLLAADPVRRALARQLMLWSGDYLAPAWKAWMALHFVPDTRADDPAVVQGRADVAAHLDVLAERLTGADWLVGDYSLADVCYAPFVTTFAMVGLGDLLDARPAVRAWVERLNTRPSIRDTAPAAPG
ncbi:MAG TPA: glutathione S-transferase family protein [Candidatus Binatia bacterium]|jgi:glutathione S-transferase|nr:glutathione S-transferase family protein [Candidatus Binatia bacterium]